MYQRDPSTGPRRRLSQAAMVCFSISGIAFVACAMGLFVNHYLTGSLAIGGTAAVGLIYLAMGVMNLGFETDVETIRIDVGDEETNRSTTAFQMALPEPAVPSHESRRRATVARGEEALASSDAGPQN